MIASDPVTHPCLLLAVLVVAAEPGPSSSAGPSAAADAIRKRVSPPRLIMETVDEANHTDSGTSVSVDANSPKPTSVDLPKKSKGFFHKVKKTFRKTMDNLRTRVSERVQQRCRFQCCSRGVD